MLWLRVPAIAVGAGLTLWTLLSVVLTIIVPRPARSRLSGVVKAVMELAALMVPGAKSDYRVRDRIQAVTAPLFLVIRLVFWIGLLVLGFGLLFWGTSSDSLSEAIRLSATSVLPLGLTHAESGLSIAIAFLETASGVIVVALQISYLPSLYGSFNRRETLVTMLDSSSGSPPWGPEILARHALIDNETHLAQLYRDWEAWAADVAESHSSYSTLLYFRSPDPRTSWILALLASMDAAALQLSLNPLTAPPDGRPFLRMGVVCLRSLCGVTGIPFSSDPKPDDPIELTFEEFSYAVERMEVVGWRPEQSREEAWTQFRGWRVNYERMAYQLARLVDAPPGPWSGPRSGRLRSSMMPVRPPHRAPSPEREQVLQTTRVRRARRAAKLAHAHLPEAGAAPPESGSTGRERAAGED